MADVSTPPPALRIVIDDAVVADGPILQDPVETPEPWHALAGGERIELGPMPDGLRAVELFVPSTQPTAEDDRGMSLPFHDELVDVGITVNRQPWGWAWDEPSGRWRLLPEAHKTSWRTLFDFDASAESGIVSASIAVRCCAYDQVGIAGLFVDDGEMRVPWTAVDYHVDRAAFALAAAQVAFSWETGSQCPICLEARGWLVIVATDPALTGNWLLDTITSQWPPCDLHAEQAKAGVDLYGTMRWTGAGWIAAG